MSFQREVFVFENTYKLTNDLVKRWLSCAREKINQTGRFTVALSGGKTPVEFYCKLSGCIDFDLWDKVHFFQTDERFVPPTHPDNNWKLIKETLLDSVPVPSENFHFIRTDLDNAQKAAEIYQNQIKNFFGIIRNEMPSFDFILLGLGEDGHTASLFPKINQPETSVDQFVVAVSSETLERSRVSLTYSVLNAGSNVVFLVTGLSKSGIVQKLLQSKEDFPAAHILPKNGHLSFFLDNSAAKKLSFSNQFTYQGEAVKFVM